MSYIKEGIMDTYIEVNFSEFRLFILENLISVKT